MKQGTNRAAVLVCICMRMILAGTPAVVLQTDFGTKDGAVAAMKGVIYSVSTDVTIFDLTHEIPPFDVWEAAYRLEQTAKYWPEKTIFVSVVDPGVGTERKSVVLETKTGHFFVSPDNGSLTLVAQSMGIKEVREIDETKHLLQGAEQSYTFHGRDLYAYTAAKLAAGSITFEEVGKKRPLAVETLSFLRASLANDTIYGNVPILDVQYGNVWTNVGVKLLKKLQVHLGDTIWCAVDERDKTRFKGAIVYARTFGEVTPGEPLLYVNSLGNMALALNRGSFAQRYSIGSGQHWTVRFWK